MNGQCGENQMKIKLVNQREDNDCVLACIAMVTGKKYQYLRDKYSPKLPMNLDEQNIILVKEGIYPREVKDNRYLSKGGLYIVATPSLNKPGVMHALVIDCQTDDWKVYDPQKGRPCYKYYIKATFKQWYDAIEIIKVWK